MKHIFIINPAAGSKDRTDEYRQKIETLCAGLDYEIHVSQAPGNCREIALAAARSGENCRLYACGGDGTLNEVASGAAGFPNAAVSVFSGGSGNDFVKLFDDPKAFFDLERLLDAQEVAFDMIDCNGELALNICSVGLDARIGTDVSRYKRLPLLSGFRAYAASTLINVIKGISEHYVIEVNGERIDGKKTMVCVCNGRFYGGGFNPVPEADPTDGVLDVLIVEKVSRLRVASVVGTYKNGGYRKLPQFIRHVRTKTITVRCDRETPVNLDGELRMAESVRMSVADKKLRFFYPRGLHWQTSAQALCAGK